jgi:hypothetical protein
MTKLMLALAALCSAGTIAAQTPSGQGVPTAFHGRWAVDARACSQGDEARRAENGRWVLRPGAFNRTPSHLKLEKAAWRVL